MNLTQPLLLAPARHSETQLPLGYYFFNDAYWLIPRGVPPTADRCSSSSSHRPSLVPGVYKHFKGDLYVVVTVATLVPDQVPHMVYHPCGDLTYWARPMAMFEELVTAPGTGEKIPRFAPLIQTRF